MPQGMQVGMSNVCLLTTVPGISTPLHLPIRVRSVRSGRRDKSIIPKIYVKHFQNKIPVDFYTNSNVSGPQKPYSPINTFKKPENKELFGILF